MSATQFGAVAPLHVAVLLGGTSAERDVSLESGNAVADALSVRGHHVTPIDPKSLDVTTMDWSSFDVVFNALHGTFGEDGEIQRILEIADVPFTGSSSGASRLSFSKSAAKERFHQFGIPTPLAVLVHETDTADRIHQRAERIGFPLVVKPDAQGSSLGVSIVQSPADLPTALSQSFHLSPFTLLEAFVPGTEWTVAVLEDAPLPPIRIRPRNTFFDFAAKYADETTGYDFGDDVPPRLRSRLADTAVRCCRAIGTSGAARVDLIVDNYDRAWMLEVNTVPGMTANSLLPKAAQRAGMSFADLCERLVGNAQRTVLRRAA